MEIQTLLERRTQLWFTRWQKCLCGIMLVELARNISPRMQGKAVHRDMSHGDILLQNHPGGLWRKMWSGRCSWAVHTAESGVGSVRHGKQANENWETKPFSSRNFSLVPSVGKAGNYYYYCASWQRQNI